MFTLKKLTLFLALCASVWQVQTGFLVKDELVLHLTATGSVSRVDVFTPLPPRGKYLPHWRPQNATQLLLNDLCQEPRVKGSEQAGLSPAPPAHGFMLRSKPGQLCSLARSGNRRHTHTHTYLEVPIILDLVP